MTIIIVPMRRLPDDFCNEKTKHNKTSRQQNSVQFPLFSLRISTGNCMIKPVSKTEMGPLFVE